MIRESQIAGGVYSQSRVLANAERRGRVCDQSHSHIQHLEANRGCLGFRVPRTDRGVVASLSREKQTEGRKSRRSAPEE